MFGKNDVEGLPYVVKILLQSPMDSREGSIVALGSKIRFFTWRAGRPQSDFSVNCSSVVLSWWLTQGSEASTLQVDHRSSSWPMLLLVVCTNWQGPGSH